MLALGSLHPVFASLMVIGATTLCCALLLGLASAKRRRRPDEVIEDILLCLPQTQCGQCGHPGCRPYAEAIAGGDPINRCPPGGTITIRALAKLLDVPEIALDPIHGTHKPREVAYIREAECIGCVKCIAACPVDAILGASGQMHTVIALECTGCDLCVEPCPVDCIEMRVLPDDSVMREEQEQRQRAQLARRRFEARQSRIHDIRQVEQARRSAREGSLADARAAQVEAAVARVRAKTVQKPGAESQAAASAVERARRKALDRVAKTISVDTTPSPPPTPETLQRLLTKTERKLQRTRQKHAAACAAADTATVVLLTQAIKRLEQRLADVRHDLQRVPGADA